MTQRVPMALYYVLRGRVVPRGCIDRGASYAVAVSVGQGSRKGRVVERLFHRELTTSTSYCVEHRAGSHKLEAVAESASLAHCCQDLDIAKGQREFQAHNFAYRNFHTQHGRNPGFADVQRVSPNDRRITWVYADVHLQLVPGTTPSVYKARSLAVFDGSTNIQFYNPFA